MSQEDFITTVKADVQVINQTALDDTLLTYVVEEVIDRVLLYLNITPSADTQIDERLAKIVARIASGIFNQTNANVENGGADTAINSVSDNGQSVSYSDKVKNYLATNEDGELFGGFAKLLAPYRRINVIS
jgi:hypothetical protein